MGYNTHIFRELLELFPTTKRGKYLMDCIKFIDKYYAHEDYDLLKTNVSSYYKIKEELNYTLSIQHYLYFRYYAYDYNNEYSEILDTYRLTEINDDAIINIREVILKKYKDKVIASRAIAYLNHLLVMNGYKIPKDPFANQIIDVIRSRSQYLKTYGLVEESPRKKAGKNLKKSRKAGFNDIMVNLSEICIEQRPEKLAIALDVPLEIILQLLQSMFLEFKEDQRITKNQFLVIKPSLAKYITNIMSEVPVKVDESLTNKAKYKNKSIGGLIYTPM